MPSGFVVKKGSKNLLWRSQQQSPFRNHTPRVNHAVVFYRISRIGAPFGPRDLSILSSGPESIGGNPPVSPQLSLSPFFPLRRLTWIDQCESRSPHVKDWIKLKCNLRQEFVVGGITRETGVGSGVIS